MRHSIAWPFNLNSSCVNESWFARRDADLLANQIDPGNQFRHRMLDLQARVHLEEIERRSRSETRNSTVPAPT